MNDLYDVFQKKQDTVEKNWIPKEEYAEQRKERRDELNDLVDKELDKIKSDPQAYIAYLDKQAHFNQYSVNNTLLILAQKPDATLIKESDKWREENFYFRKNEKHITIYEPGEIYKREDGTEGRSYDEKSMFDISQIQRPPRIPVPETLKVDQLLSALCYKRGVDIEKVDTLDNGKDAYYSMEDNKIYVAGNLTPQRLLTGLATETCFAEIDPHQDKFTRKDLEFSALSSAYMLCKKYGIETPPTDFAKDVSEYLGDLESKEVKSYLSGFKETFTDISKRMEAGLYVQTLAKEKEHNDVSR